MDIGEDEGEGDGRKANDKMEYLPLQGDKIQTQTFTVELPPSVDMKGSGKEKKTAAEGIMG